jgi:alkylated DNA repair dioxygenase AlkB
MIGLFDNTVLFEQGKKQVTEFLLPETELKLWEQFFTRDESDCYYKHFLDATPWAQYRRKMYDKIVADPRLTAWFGKSGTNEWTPELLQIKERVETAADMHFNSVLLNYYRDGNDSVSWHSDTLPASGKHHAIASVTFGETRIFKVRHKTRKDVEALNIPLMHGSLLLMGETMQLHYEHHIPKTARKISPRINLTFRISD